MCHETNPNFLQARLMTLVAAWLRMLYGPPEIASRAVLVAVRRTNRLSLVGLK